MLKHSLFYVHIFWGCTTKHPLEGSIGGAKKYNTVDTSQLAQFKVA
jgi:hypothetical protein